MTSTSPAPSFAVTHQVNSSTFFPVQVGAEFIVASVIYDTTPRSQSDLDETEHRLPEEISSAFRGAYRM
jgi:hypothetical protein